MSVSGNESRRSNGDAERVSLVIRCCNRSAVTAFCISNSLGNARTRYQLRSGPLIVRASGLRFSSLASTNGARQFCDGATIEQDGKVDDLSESGGEAVLQANCRKRVQAQFNKRLQQMLWRKRTLQDLLDLFSDFG